MIEGGVSEMHMRAATQLYNGGDGGVDSGGGGSGSGGGGGRSGGPGLVAAEPRG